MLKIQANIKETVARYEDITLYGDGVMKTAENVVVEASNPMGLGFGDVISFHRGGGDGANFDDERTISGIFNNFSGDEPVSSEYYCAGFNDIPLYFSECEVVRKKMAPGEQDTTFLRLILKDEHCYTQNPNVFVCEKTANGCACPPEDEFFVNGYVDCEFQRGSQAETDLSYLCNGDFIVYNDVFLYEVSGIRNGRFDLYSSSVKNYKTRVYFEENGEKKYLNAITPCNLGGFDIRNEIYLYGDASLISEIARNPYSYTFFGKDERFFTEGTTFTEDGETFTRLVLKPCASVRWKLGDLRISLPMAQDFDTTLNQDDAIGQYIEETALSSINSIVDYEKQQFVPVYNGKDVQKMVFKIHLRKRTDYDEWKTNDTLLWNNDENSLSGDSIEYMGFDEEDVYYQRKKVTETFLRMSIYNTRDRRTQKLLYTAKIYLNSSDLYGQYIENLAKKKDNPNNRLFENPLSGIQTEFICTHKYDYSASTEGFYFHLFPSNLNEDDNGKVFIKFELNNARYGYTLPLVMFSGAVIDGETKVIKHGYLKEDSGLSVDMSMLYNDLYVPVEISKAEDRYEWEFIDKNIDNTGDNGGTIILHLFEPRVNGMP